MKTILAVVLGALVLAAGVLGWMMWGSDSAGVRTGVVLGAEAPLGNGLVRTWERLDGAGALEAVGVTFGESMLSGLPEEDVQLSLALPGSSASSPFTHVLLDWAPHGHVPPGVYDVPHFDVHFYIVPEAERLAVEGAPEDTVPVQERYLPAGYISTVEVVPAMGVHWADGAAPELNGEPFTQTFLYGYYKGRLTFFEPMITQAYFEQRTDATFSIKQPEAYRATGKRYPTQYTIRYDERVGEYTVSLEGMADR